MGLLLKVFIPLLGAALAFYFYSGSENFSEGKPWEKQALQAQQGCCQRGREAQEGPARVGGEGRADSPQARGQSTGKTHGITLALPGQCLTSVNDLFGKQPLFPL